MRFLFSFFPLFPPSPPPPLLPPPTPPRAATTAAVLSGALDAAISVDGPIVAIVSGGNMGVEKLAEWSRALP